MFVAVGAHLSKRQAIPSQDAGRILDALQFLKQIELGGDTPKIGRKVAIYGGGNTAMDAARTARRLGVESVIIYRRTREPATTRRNGTSRARVQPGVINESARSAPGRRWPTAVGRTG